MKVLLSYALLIIISPAICAVPLSNVSSWEGEFHYESSVPIHVDGLSSLQMQLYRLADGSQGTVIGFVDENGELLLAPCPNASGVQPIYSQHVVTQVSRETFQIIVIYDVQGNGGQKLAENYRYDRRQIIPVSISFYGGKSDPLWRMEWVSSAGERSPRCSLNR